MKIKSKTNKNRYLYINLLENSNSDKLIIFLSGFSGGKDLPLFKSAEKFFSKKNFSALKINFCNDFEDKIQEKDTFNLKDIDFDLYNKELKNIINSLRKYKQYIFVGHSFGTPIFLYFLSKNKTYLKNSHLIIWDPSLLPWPNNLVKDLKGEIGEKFYKEVTSINTSDLLKSLNKEVCIIGADGGKNREVKKYFSALNNRGDLELVIIKDTNHYFKGITSKKELFKNTLNFINSAR